MIFEMLVGGRTQPEIADQLGVAMGTVNAEKDRIATLLKKELELPGTPRRRAWERIESLPAKPAVPEAVERALSFAPSEVPKPIESPSQTPREPSMNRVQSPIGAEVVKAIKAGAEVIPVGQYAGPSMTVKVPRSHLSAGPVDGIIVLPTPIILSSNTSGEQEMVVSAIREIGEQGGSTRTFALYAFCKDELLETPSDLSRYKFKSVVKDRNVIDIVTQGDLRKPEAISQRIWDHLKRS
jgi:hypothetical protein